MALTVTKLRGKDAKALSRTPNQSIQIISVDFDSVYPTGGEALVYDQPIVHAWHLYGGTYVFRYNEGTGKILAYKAVDTDGMTPDGTLVEEDDMTNLSAQTGIVFAVLVDHNT